MDEDSEGDGRERRGRRGWRGKEIINVKSIQTPRATTKPRGEEERREEERERKKRESLFVSATIGNCVIEKR